MRNQAARVTAAVLTFIKQNRTISFRILPCFAIFLTLIATGFAPTARGSGQLTPNPSSVSFGRVWVGRTHTTSVTIANTGNAAVTVSGDALTGSGYTVSGIHLPMNLAAGAKVTFDVSFTPKSAGSFPGTLKLISNASDSTVVIALSGSGVSRSAGYVSATPLTAQFGTVPVGTKNTQTVQLQNTGSRAVTISSVTATGAGLSVSGITMPFDLAAGSTTQFAIGFQPTAAGSVSGAVAIASTASDSSLSIATSGTGAVTTRLLSVTPASVAFGNVNVSASATTPVTLKNTGNSSLTISSDTSTGTGVSVTGMSGTTLSPGQSATLTAGFAPKAAGNVSGAITITSNATNGTSVAVPVSGTGVAATSHTVALQWQASTSSGVSGYYVYRATSSAGPYAKLSGSAMSGTSYTDSSVSSGTTYYYAVTTVASTGAESSYSNQATAVIP